VDWTTPEGLGPFYSNFAGAATGSGSVTVVGRLFGGELSGWAEMVVSRSDGSVLGAVRGRELFGDQPCAPVLASIASGRVIAGVADYVSGPSLLEYEIEIPLETGNTRVFNTLTPELLHGNWGGSRSAGPLFAAISLDPSAAILKVPYDGSTPITIAKWSPEQDWLPEAPIVVGSDVLFWAMKQDRGQAFVYHSTAGTTESYLDIPGTDIVAIRTDGQRVVWMQASPPYYQGGEIPTTVELWSSPYSASPSGLVPTKIADLDPALWNYFMVFESGLVVLRSSLWIPPSQDVSWSRDIVLRLEDGVYWTLDAPFGMWWGDTMFADADEVAMPVQPPWKESQTSTVRRQRLSALGPPTPVSGVLGVP
jgi:hypothetical protein